MLEHDPQRVVPLGNPRIKARSTAPRGVSQSNRVLHRLLAPEHSPCTLFSLAAILPTCRAPLGAAREFMTAIGFYISKALSARTDPVKGSARSLLATHLYSDFREMPPGLGPAQRTAGVPRTGARP